MSDMEVNKDAPYGLPRGWEKSRFGELGLYLNGRGFKKSEWRKSGRPIIRIQDLTGTNANPNYFDGVAEERHVVRSGDFLISWAATLGAYIWSGPEGVLNQHIFKVKSFIDERYHYYGVLQAIDDMYRRTRGTGMVHIVKKDFDNTVLPLAPEAEQTRIADRIDELFTDLAAGVAALERTRKKLKRYRSAVLHAAVTGRLTEAWRKEHGPPAESGEQLLARLLVQRRQQWEERTLADYQAKGKQPPKNWRQRYQEPVEPKTDDLPELPEGWCWASMDQLSWDCCYGTSVRCDYDADGVTVLRIPNIAKGELDLSDLKNATASLELDERDLLVPGDLLVCRTNGSIRLIGKSALVRRELESNYYFASYLIRFRISDPSVAEVIHCVCESPSGRKFIEANCASSAGQHNISMTVLQQLPVPLPPAGEQPEIASSLAEKLSQIEAMEIEVERGLARATRLRQAILKAAFAGKLVPQDPSDEPAAVLLERIRTEREALAAQSSGRPKRALRKQAALKKTVSAAKRKSTKKRVLSGIRG